MMSRNILDAFQQQLSGCRMADIAETEDADHAFALVDHRQRGVAARNGACAASNLILWLVCQFRQLGDIRRNSPRLVGRRLISFFSSQPCRWQA